MRVLKPQQILFLKHTPLKNNETLNLCSACQGKCCKRAAGIYHPEQVIEELKILEKTGNLPQTMQIDAWDSSNELPHTMFIRPAHINSKGRLIDYSWGGQCTNLGEKGCVLSFETRPKQCQDLEAVPTFDCESDTSKLVMAKIWLPYQKYFRNL